MHTNNLDLIESYKTNTGVILYMFSINLGLDLSTNQVKRTTRRGFKTLAEAETAFNQLTV